MDTRWLVAAGATMLGLATPLAVACDQADFLHQLGEMESEMNPAARNPYGYIGLFQFGEAALQDAGYYNGDTTQANNWNGTWSGRGGATSLNAFLSNPDLQVQAIVAYQNQLLSQIHQYGLDASIGRTIDGVPITMSGLLAGAHLVGIANLQRFVNSGGATVPRDGNGVSVTTYISDLGGCSVGGAAPGYAAVAAAPGTAGVGGVPVLPSGPFTPMAPAPISVDPDTAFSMASGRSPAELRQAVSLIIATSLALWLAWTALAHFNAWRKRALSLYALQSDIVRACVVFCVLILILQ